MRVLVELAERAGEVVPKQRLLDSVWPDTFVGDDVLSRTIFELRRVFEDDPKSPRFIQTIPKSGYRLVAPVRFETIAPPIQPRIDDKSVGRTATHDYWKWTAAVLTGTVAVVTIFIVWKVNLSDKPTASINQGLIRLTSTSA
jgi:hypothetical protein